MSTTTDVAVIGAGPYGLSIAAHLRARGVDYRVIGKPMHAWLAHMPKGMCLKSEGFASNLYDPDRRFTLKRFCKQEGITYADLGWPVPLKTFTDYGLDFQQRLVPAIENRAVVAITQSPVGFLLRLEGGEGFTSRRVVVATGLTGFRNIPAELAHLPAEFLSHSSDHHDLRQFKNCSVVVIGGGASAVDLAALLHESGAKVQLIARRSSIAMHDKMKLPRPLRERLRYPMSLIGPGWRSRLASDAPWLYHYLPEDLRVRVATNFLGPAGGWFMRERLAPVPQLFGYRLQRVEITKGRAHLHLVSNDGLVRQLATEHIVVATGYRVDLRRLPFLSDETRSQLKEVEHTPVLSSDFQSSLPGLYFVGPAAANSFGPVMRFAAGAKYTARRISRHLAST